MKHGKKPTVAQKKLIASHKYKSTYLNPDNWLVIKNLPEMLVISHRENKTLLTISKGGGKDAKHTLEGSEQN